MMSKWNRMIETGNWLFYALMRAMIPGGLVLHFFGIPYSGAFVAFSLILVCFAYRRWRSPSSVETAFWLIAAIACVIWQFELNQTSQWVMLGVYGLWIFNQSQLESYLIPGAFGRSLSISLGIIFLILTATPMVGWEETTAFIQWSIPIYLLSAALMMVRINLLIVYRQKEGHQINREKNLLLFNGISLIFFVIGGFFLFSTWLPPSWTSGITQGIGTVISWFLYPLAVVLAKGSQILKNLMKLLQPDQGSPEPIGDGILDVESSFGSREAMVPFMQWAGWIVLMALLAIMIVITIRRKRKLLDLRVDDPQVEEKSFLRLDEILKGEPKQAIRRAAGKKEEIPKIRMLFAEWLRLLNREKPFLQASTTPNQVVEQVKELGIKAEESEAIVDIYNRVRYRGDQATPSEEERMGNKVKQLEEKQNIQ